MSLGRWPAAVALAAISARYAAGEVRSPGGLLRKMIDLHEAGDLRLDRTLYGIADRILEPENCGVRPRGSKPKRDTKGLRP